MLSNLVTEPLPPKLSELIADDWDFPLEFPVVDDTHSPDATRTLKEVIAYSISEYYFDHRIGVYTVDVFTQRLSIRLYNVMIQHQYWIDEYLGLIDDKQFFYNDETHDGGTVRVTESNRTANSTNNDLSKTSDTPQNSVADIDNYLSAATKSEGGEEGEEEATATDTFTDTTHINKSTLGDITVQFRNFAEFPNFMDKLIKAVSPCFLQYYGNEEVDYGTTE